MFAGGFEDFVGKMSNSAFARSAGDADELHVTDRIAIVAAEEPGTGVLGFCSERGFFVFATVFV